MSLQEKLQEVLDTQIAWPFHEFREVFHWYNELCRHLPDQKGNVEPELAALLDEQGSGERTNPLETSSIDRLARHLLSKYTPKIARANLYRFLMILRFLRKHRDRLQADGFLKTTSLETGDISWDLLRSLCHSPFTRPVQRRGELFYDFEYTLIKKNAEQIHRESNQEG